MLESAESAVKRESRGVAGRNSGAVIGGVAGDTTDPVVGREISSESRNPSMKLTLPSFRDASPNKTLVLLKFEEPSAASDFILFHSGTTFSRDPDRSETCHPIRIHHLLLQDMSLLAPSPSPALPKLLDRVPQVYELPTCPVCLERMDSVVTGMLPFSPLFKANPNQVSSPRHAPTDSTADVFTGGATTPSPIPHSRHAPSASSPTAAPPHHPQPNKPPNACAARPPHPKIPGSVLSVGTSVARGTSAGMRGTIIRRRDMRIRWRFRRRGCGITSRISESSVWGWDDC